MKHITDKVYNNQNGRIDRRRSGPGKCSCASRGRTSIGGRLRQRWGGWIPGIYSFCPAAGTWCSRARHGCRGRRRTVPVWPEWHQSPDTEDTELLRLRFHACICVPEKCLLFPIQNPVVTGYQLINISTVQIGYEMLMCIESKALRNNNIMYYSLLQI